MKVEVEFIVIDSENKRVRGRRTWIDRDKNGALTFGTIYLQEDKAPKLTKVEVEYLEKCAGTRYLINRKVV